MITSNTSFEVFKVVKIQVEVLWVVTPCSDVVGYQRFEGPCCLHLQGEDGDEDRHLNFYRLEKFRYYNKCLHYCFITMS
jgi:hypothetical protein